MQARRVIPAAMLALVLAGCGSFEFRWPWQRDVPVTSPVEVTSPADRRTFAPWRKPEFSKAPPPVNVEGPTPLVALAGDPVPKQPKWPPAPESIDEPELAIRPRPEAGPPVQPSAVGPSEPPKAPPDVEAPNRAPPEPVEQPQEPAPVEAPKEMPPSRMPGRSPPEPEVGKTTVLAASMLQVNDRFITIEDVLRSVSQELSALPKTISENSFRRQAAAIIDRELRRQMQQALVLAEAQSRLSEEQKNQVQREVDKSLQDMVASAGGSRKALEEQFAQKGTTLKTVLGDHKNRLMVQLYLQRKFMPAIAINRDMLWSYYRKRQSEFHSAKEVQMQIIAAPFAKFLDGPWDGATERQRRDARTHARKVVFEADRRLQNQQDFGKIARELSRGLKAESGGVWPMMPAGSFREQKVEAAAFVLRQGQASDVLEAPTGFYIVKALKVRRSRDETFEEAQEKIHEILRQEQYRKLVDSYFRQLLRGATIVESEKFILLAVERAADRFWKSR